MSGLQSLASTTMFFTLWRKTVCLISLMTFISVVSTTSLSLDSEQTLIPSLEDGIIILYGQREVSVLNSFGYMGHQPDLDEGESLEELQDPGIEWESAMLQGDTNGTFVVPEIVCSLDDEAIEELQRTVDPMEHSQSHGRDLYTRYKSKSAEFTHFGKSLNKTQINT